MKRLVLSLGVVIAMALGARVVLVPETPAPTPPRALGPGERWLPVEDWGGFLCAGTGYRGDFRLHGSPDDPHLAWMTFPDGSRYELAWPLGYSARFDPSLEILDQHGKVLAREGSLVTGGCQIGQSGALSVELMTPRPPSTPPPDVKPRHGPTIIH